MPKAVDHKSRDHALLSASGSHRWLACTPSARLEDKADISLGSSSVYAEEGTLAHELSEITLHKALGNLSEKGFAAEKKKIQTKLKKLLGDSHDHFHEMETEVQKYVDIVLEIYEDCKKKDPGAIILIEEKVDFSNIAPEGSGTLDVAIIAFKVLFVIDLKYGKGVKVEAKTNPQAMLYSTGALNSFDPFYEIERVNHMIIQPRLDNFSSWECSKEYIQKWGETVAKPRADLAFKGEGEKVAGDHCKFCKVKALCRTLAEKNLELAKHEFRDPDLMELEELVPIFNQVQLLQDWVSAVGDYLLAKALEGTEVPGMKVVEGRSQRKWTDEEAIIKLLRKKKYKVSDIMISKLGGIGHIEKLLGKGPFYELLDPYVEKPAGKATLVPESDKRPRIGITQAQRDFEEPIDLD